MLAAEVQEEYREDIRRHCFSWMRSFPEGSVDLEDLEQECALVLHKMVVKQGEVSEAGIRKMLHWRMIRKCRDDQIRRIPTVMISDQQADVLASDPEKNAVIEDVLIKVRERLTEYEQGVMADMIDPRDVIKEELEDQDYRKDVSTRQWRKRAQKDKVVSTRQLRLAHLAAFGTTQFRFQKAVERIRHVFADVLGPRRDFVI